MSQNTLARCLTSWWFLLPAAVLFCGWQLYPILRVLWISFTDYQFLKPDADVRWVGLANYAQALSDPLVRAGFLRALVFTALFLPGMIFIPMLAAILIDRVRQPRLATAYRLILLIPAMIPGPLIFVLFKWLYHPFVGPLNHILTQVGLSSMGDPLDWLGSPWLSFPAVTMMEWWWGLGFHTMFYLAGLAGIPKELYEAARVDGANEWRIFWNITLPRLRPILLVLVVLRFGSAMAVIDEYLILGGEAKNTLPTYTWTVHMYNVGFKLGNMDRGYAAAIGWLGALGMLLVVAALFWFFRSRDE